MKAVVVDFQIGLHHINQLRGKVVRITDDAPDRYRSDGNWQHVAEADRAFGIRCLEAVRGRECRVASSQWVGAVIWYELYFSPPIEVVNQLGHPHAFPFLHITADYVEVLEHGFMEAR